MNPFAINHDPQLQSPDRQLKPGLEAIDWRIHRRTSSALDNLAQQCNPIIQGWWNYYGAFYQRSMLELFHYVDNRLERWARRKYKTLAQDKRRSGQWLRKMKMVAPRMFVHW